MTELYYIEGRALCSSLFSYLEGVTITAESISEQAVLTLANQIVNAVRQEIAQAPYAAFRRATVRKKIDKETYCVSMDDRLVTLPLYGNGELKAGEQVWVVSPTNSRNYHDMFILGK